MYYFTLNSLMWYLCLYILLTFTNILIMIFISSNGTYKFANYELGRDPSQARKQGIFHYTYYQCDLFNRNKLLISFRPTMHRETSHASNCILTIFHNCLDTSKAERNLKAYSILKSAWHIRSSFIHTFFRRPTCGPDYLW